MSPETLASAPTRLVSGDDHPLVNACQAFWRMDRHLTSRDTDLALEMLAHPCTAIERYAPGTPVWTWRVPGRWIVREAQLSVLYGSRFEVIADYAVSPLSVVAGSMPVDTVMTWKDLRPHLHVGPEAIPTAVPWHFSYYGAPQWGFCLSHRTMQQLEADMAAGVIENFRVRIDTHVSMQPEHGVAVRHGVVAGGGDEEILLCANVCHPYQVNDSITGAVAVERIIRRLQANPLPEGSRAVRVLYCPETIGSIAWCAHHPSEVARTVAAISTEMLGTDGPLVLQRSQDPTARLTRMARRVLIEHDAYAKGASEALFRDPTTALNDEIVFALAREAGQPPIPTVALTRYPYDAYHTSADAPAILSESQLAEAIDILEALVRLAATDYTPRRTYRGPLFLSGYGLWIDWRTDRQGNADIERILCLLEGDRTVFDIAETIGRPYAWVRDFCDRLLGHGLIERR